MQDPCETCKHHETASYIEAGTLPENSKPCSDCVWLWHFNNYEEEAKE